MLGSQSQCRGTHCTQQTKNRDLQVCWANVGRGIPHHVTLLQVAYMQGMDVICIQEPYTAPGTKTQNHPSYDCYMPVDSWDSIEEVLHEAERPRIMTYVHKGAGLKTQQRRPMQSRDLLWTDVNGYAILNIY